MAGTTRTPRARKAISKRAAPAINQRNMEADDNEPMPGGSHLGELGVLHEDVDLTFTYFGKLIRVNPLLSEFVMVEFMDQANQIDENDVRAMTMTKDFVRALVHEDDFEVFWLQARTHRQTQMDLQKIAKAIFESVVGRPTGQPSGSVSGRPETSENSRDDSYDRAMAAREGRPDLQLAIVQAQSVHRAG
jgi:hypothetical protein